ncbi:MaoC family dehydratase [Erythrobacter alti]|uniref:MaoC family dehydratase n=1 Tax=Erythrobacter alti TaxID=1896145 RepID=UPI0030F422DB
MQPIVIDTPQDIIAMAGTEIGPTDWVIIEQDQVDKFAEVTKDHQWIHVDVERAKDGPYGGTIAHGYMTMSLASHFLESMIEVRGFGFGVNVGTDRLRFISPVRVGSRVRGRGEILGAEEKGGGVQSVVRITIEIEGEDKPACVIDTISRYYPEAE